MTFIDNIKEERTYPEPFERWKHFKGNNYQIIGVAEATYCINDGDEALLTAKHTETEEEIEVYVSMCGLEIKTTDSIHRKQQFIVYQALYEDFQLWIRPAAEFMGVVDKTKYVETTQEYRFEKLKIR